MLLTKLFTRPPRLFANLYAAEITGAHLNRRVPRGFESVLEARRGGLSRCLFPRSSMRVFDRHGPAASVPGNQQRHSVSHKPGVGGYGASRSPRASAPCKTARPASDQPFATDEPRWPFPAQLRAAFRTAPFTTARTSVDGTARCTGAGLSIANRGFDGAAVRSGVNALLQDGLGGLGETGQRPPSRLRGAGVLTDEAPAWSLPILKNVVVAGNFSARRNRLACSRVAGSGRQKAAPKGMDARTSTAGENVARRVRENSHRDRVAASVLASRRFPSTFLDVARAPRSNIYPEVTKIMLPLVAAPVGQSSDRSAMRSASIISPAWHVA